MTEIICWTGGRRASSLGQVLSQIARRRLAPSIHAPPRNTQRARPGGATPTDTQMPTFSPPNPDTTVECVEGYSSGSTGIRWVCVYRKRDTLVSIAREDIREEITSRRKFLSRD